MKSEAFKYGFFKSLWVLQDYLNEIVIGGGWAPLLYFHYLLGDKSIQPLFTRDIDLIVKKDLPLVGTKTVDQLLTEAGLSSVFKTRDNPPVIHYEGNIDGFDVEIEFLTDQSGSVPDQVIKVQKDLHAEALRYISILLENVIDIKIDDFSTADQMIPLSVKAPAPAAYIFHKGLIFRRRRDTQKAAKDLFYIFNILMNCSKIENQISYDMQMLRRKYPSWFNDFMKNLDHYFQNVNSEGVLQIADQRSSGSLPNLNHEQFKQYVSRTFQKLISNLDSKG